jgi:hypothetical protein
MLIAHAITSISEKNQTRNALLRDVTRDGGIEKTKRPPWGVGGLMHLLLIALHFITVMVEALQSIT